MHRNAPPSVQRKMSSPHPLLVLIFAAPAMLALTMCGSSAQSSAPVDGGGVVPTSDGSVDAANASDASDASDAASEASSSPTDAGIVVPADVIALCDSIFGAASRSLASCCSTADMSDPEYGNVQGLITAALHTCESNLSGSVAGNRIHIDDTQAAACKSAISATLTATPLCWAQAFANRPDEIQTPLDPPACQTPVVGLQGLGAPCASDYECVAGDTCVGWTGTSDGACAAPPAIGAQCGWGSAGVSGGVLIPWYPFGPHPLCAPGGTCEGYSCLAVVGDGGACNQAADCASSGLVCVNNACAAAYEGAGGTCKDDDDCQDGLWCNFGDAGSAGTCAKRQLAGTACSGNANASHECAGDCDLAIDGGTCVALCGSH